MSLNTIIHITDASFASDVTNSQIPVIVDFWAPWCGPCRAMSPILDEISKELEGKIKVCKMNIDDNPIGPGKLGIMSIPTIIFFKDGEIIDRKIGMHTKQNLIDWVLSVSI